MTTRTLLFAGALVASTAAVFAQAAPPARQAPAAAAPAAGGPSPVGTFSAWSAYVSNDAGGKTCFAATQPTSSKYSKHGVKRGDAFFMITSIPSKNIRNEASTIIGYPFGDNVKVTVDIDGGSKFTMFTEKDSAWIENPAQETDLIAAMQKGNRMTVVGKSRRGTVTTDTYSLSGISAALDAIAKECQ